MGQQTPDGMTDHDRLIVIETLLRERLARVDDHETRIRRLERGMWVAAGFAAAAGSAIGTTAGRILGG